MVSERIVQSEATVDLCDLGRLAALLFPAWVALLFHLWELCVRPRLLPEHEVRSAVDRLIAEHGPRADDQAFIEEDAAWRRSDTVSCGTWRRIRRELRRHRTRRAAP